MGKKKAPVRPKYDYPEPVAHRTGCKVRWYYYDNEADAQKASGIAREEAIERRHQGYDFGYCTPGEIMRPAEVKKYNRAPDGGEHWEVTLP